MIVLLSIGHCPKKGLRIDCVSEYELIAYTAMKTTIAIFHRDVVEQLHFLNVGE